MPTARVTAHAPLSGLSLKCSILPISTTLHEMKIANIYQVKSFFKTVHTTKRSQTAVMRLPAGGESGPEPEAHRTSDQSMLVVEGTVVACVGSQRRTLKKGDFIVIPANTKHRITNPGKTAAVTFNVYSPPEYPRQFEEKNAD